MCSISNFNRFVLLCTLVLCALLPACVMAVAPEAAPLTAERAADDARAGWPEKFVVGYFAGDDVQQTIQDVEPIRVYLEERLGIPVESFTATNYTAVIEAMRAGHVHAMIVGPFAYVLAVQEAKAEALAVVATAVDRDAAVYDPTVPAHYYSVIFTKKGSGINSLQDLKGKDFAFVDAASTSGHLAPKTLLIQNGINPDEEMQAVFAGSHQAALLAVWTDKADAGASNEANLYRLEQEGQIELCGFENVIMGAPHTPEEIKALFDACPDGSMAILAYSNPIPGTPFAILSTLPESLKDSVKEAMLDIKDNPELISQIAEWFVDPTAELGLESLDQYYNSLRDIARLLELDLKELAD